MGTLKRLGEVHLVIYQMMSSLSKECICTLNREMSRGVTRTKGLFFYLNMLIIFRIIVVRRWSK